MFDDGSPIYRQLADRIKEEVLMGTIQPEEQIMSTNQYAAFYRINPATAAKAFGQLVDEGVLYKKRGIGMFVRRGAREALRRARRERFVAEVVDPMIAEAQVIGVPLADIAARVLAAEASATSSEEGEP